MGSHEELHGGSDQRRGRGRGDDGVEVLRRGRGPPGGPRACPMRMARRECFLRVVLTVQCIRCFVLKIEHKTTLCEGD